MMSLLTRTKGYFVVICVLMCGFLLTFSWRLLYSSYNTPTLIKHESSLTTPHIDVRHFDTISYKPEASRSYVVRLSTEEVSVNVKGRNGTKPFTKDEIGSILSKIHELGLSAAEVQEKLFSWQQQRNLSNSTSPYPKRNALIATPSVEAIVNVKRNQDKNVLMRQRTQHSQVSQHENHVRYDVDSSDKYRVSKHPANSDKLDNVISVLPNEQSHMIQSNARVTSDLPDTNSLDNKVHVEQPVINDDGENDRLKPAQRQSEGEKVQTGVLDTENPEKIQSDVEQIHTRILKNRNPESVQNNAEQVETRISDRIKPVPKESESEKAESSRRHKLKTFDNVAGEDNDESRAAQNRRQHKKYLQFLREQLTKSRNASHKAKEKMSGSQLQTERNENSPEARDPPGPAELSTSSPLRLITPHPTRNMEAELPRTNSVGSRTSRVVNRPNSSRYEELRRKYPGFSERLPMDDTEPELEGTQRPDYCRGCFDFNFPCIIDHPQLCKLSNSGGSKSVFLLMLISSAPSNYHARTVIRQTWGAKCHEPNSSIKCLFVIGLSRSKDENSRVLLENDHHQDILQLGFKDSYSNLTYKTISSFKWTTQHCYSAKYVMKTDDDMYVNTDLIPIMLQAAPTRKFMGGSCWGSSSPNRDVSSKWFVSLRSFHKPKFPPMCSGTGYIMSMDVMRSVLFASRNVPFFHLEDVYVALCLQKYGLLPVNIMGFSNMFQEFGACHYKNAVMTSHQVPPELLEEFWSSMNKCPKANISPAQLYIIMPYPDTD